MMRELRSRLAHLKERFVSGDISKDEAVERLMIIERETYDANPDAEPDGEITYAVASFHQEMLDHGQD